VGFLGGALIWKGSIFVHDEEVHQVHGLTTAASLWLSAAVGVGIGGALYLVTTYVVIIVIAILRYAPTTYSVSNLEGDDEDEKENGEHAKEKETNDQCEEVPQTNQEATRPGLGGDNDCITDDTDETEQDDRATDLPETKQDNTFRRRSVSERPTISHANRTQRQRSVRNLVPTFAE
jgi:uncharacterized membrane protein YhiD involved in acid resistance